MGQDASVNGWNAGDTGEPRDWAPKWSFVFADCSACGQLRWAMVSPYSISSSVKLELHHKLASASLHVELD